MKKEFSERANELVKRLHNALMTVMEKSEVTADDNTLALITSVYSSVETVDSILKLVDDIKKYKLLYEHS